VNVISRPSFSFPDAALFFLAWPLQKNSTTASF
jgi:hypothetical protein